jgi:phosphoenolpyruvate carboxykinase (GTP)
VPAPRAIETDGLDLSAAQIEELLKVDPEEWKVQLPQIQQHYASFGDALPEELRGQLDALELRLGATAG